MSHRSVAGATPVALLLAVIVAVLVGFLWGVAGAPSDPAGTPQPRATLLSNPPTPAAPSSPEPAQHPALAALDRIPVATSAALWYERSHFGDGWGDPDRNGCDARNDVLARDLVEVAYRPGTRDCVVASGTLHDPYTGASISFVRGNVTSQAVQIDHVVPLAWAWRHGASQWTYEQRVRFHSDQANLLAVDGPTNMQKSDSGPARWMPPNTAHHCDYATQFVSVVETYQLSLPDDDRSVLRNVLATC